MKLTYTENTFRNCVTQHDTVCHITKLHSLIRSTGTNVTHTILMVFILLFLFRPPTTPSNASLTGSPTQDITTKVAAPNHRASLRTRSSNSVVPSLTMTTVTIHSHSIISNSNRHHALRKSHIQMVMVMTFSITVLRTAAERTAPAIV